MHAIMGRRIPVFAPLITGVSVVRAIPVGLDWTGDSIFKDAIGSPSETSGNYRGTLLPVFPIAADLNHKTVSLPDPCTWLIIVRMGIGIFHRVYKLRGLAISGFCRRQPDMMSPRD